MKFLRGRQPTSLLDVLSLAHIINPIIVPEHSDLFVAQPITFETMRRARDAVRSELDVALLSAQFPEDRALVPEGFVATPDLVRSTLDLGKFKVARKLPLIEDILDRLYEHAPAAEFLIYTNVDIALMPHFYSAVGRIINRGFDAFVINRRSISTEYLRVDEIPLMYAQAGKPHPGYDCFVFRRDIYPKFRLGSAFVGVPPIGRIILVNLICNAALYAEFKDLHLTFHLGDERVWQSNQYADYDSRNRAEYERVLAEYAPCLESLDDAQLRPLRPPQNPNSEDPRSPIRHIRRLAGKVFRAAHLRPSRSRRGRR